MYSRQSDGLSSDFESDEEFKTVYTCNICKTSNASLADFLRHSKIHSQEEKQLALKKLIITKETEELAARKAAAQKGFKVQMVAGSSVTLYLCSTCGQGNLLLRDLDQHCSLHPRASESHYCYLCQQHFKDNSELDLHLGIHLDNNDLFCQFCNKTYNIIQDLELHESTHLQEEFVCVECSQSFKSKSSVLFHFRKSHFTNSCCVICTLQLGKGISINEHFMTHTLVNAIKRIVQYFTCEICQKKYDSKIALQRHVLFVHNDRVRHICEHCGFITCNEKSLKTHVALAHLNVEKLRGENCREKSVVREKCISNFGRDLTVMGRDNSEKTLQNKEAPHLNKEISNKSNINSLPFQCEICYAYFKLEFELDDHSKTHNVIYQCYFCFKEFVTDKYLQEHLAECQCAKMESGETVELTTLECNSVDCEVVVGL